MRIVPIALLAPSQTVLRMKTAHQEGFSPMLAERRALATGKAEPKPRFCKYCGGVVMSLDTGRSRE